MGVGGGGGPAEWGTTPKRSCEARNVKRGGSGPKKKSSGGAFTRDPEVSKQSLSGSRVVPPWKTRGERAMSGQDPAQTQKTGEAISGPEGGPCEENREWGSTTPRKKRGVYCTKETSKKRGEVQRGERDRGVRPLGGKKK